MKRLEKLRAFWEKHGYLCVLSACFVLVMTTAVLTRKPAPQPESPETTFNTLSLNILYLHISNLFLTFAA